MEKLLFSNMIFEEGAGRTYRILINYSLPALIFGAMEIAVLNTSFGSNLDNYPVWLEWLFLLVTICYVIPGIFIMPTAWFLRSGKTRLLRESCVMVSAKSVEYHKVVSKSTSGARESVYVCTQIRKVEERKKDYLVIGRVQEKNSGNQYSELSIPKAFKDMEKIRRAARYR